MAITELAAGWHNWGSYDINIIDIYHEQEASKIVEELLC